MTELYKPSRNENGDWLDLFEEIQSEASSFFCALLKKHPNLHPYDVSQAVKDIISYDAALAHRINRLEK